MAPAQAALVDRRPPKKSPSVALGGLGFSEGSLYQIGSYSLKLVEASGSRIESLRKQAIEMGDPKEIVKIILGIFVIKKSLWPRVQTLLFVELCLQVR